MATQQEKLAQLRSLNTQLGLPEDDGIVSSYDQKVQELRRLDEQLAKTPESFEEYVERRKVEDARSLGQKSSAFLDSFMEGGKALAKEGANAIGELFAGEVGTKELGGVYEVGKTDFGRFAKTIGGSVMDNFYSDEEEMRREYQRYVDNFLYNQEVRPAMLNTYDEEGRDFVSFGANFIDPTLLVPAGGLIAKGGSLGAKAVASGAKGVSKAAKAGAFAARSPRLIKLSRAMAQTSRGVDKVAKGADKVATGLGKASEIASIPSQLFAKGTRGAIKGTAKAGQFAAKAIGKGGEITSKVAGAPRSVITKIASSAVDPKVAGSGILGAQVVAAGTGAIPGLGLLTATEGLGYIANKTGRGMERVLGALSSSAGQKRFLQRLATSAESKAVRRAALFAHRYGGTRLGDISFNMLANGATVGSLNAALAYAAGEGPEGVGAAAGSGAVIGGALPFGQSGMRGGKTQKARDEKSISNFLDAKLAQEQKEQFSKLSPEAKLAFATVEEAGIKAPTLEFLDGKTYLNLLREETPNLRKAPEADFDETTNTITVNTDGSFKKASELALEILSHELGHGFIRQAIKDDPFFASKILKEYQPKKGEESFEFSFTTDSAGSPIDSIQVNSKAKQIAELYDSIQQGIGIGTDANKLAQEIGAEQFAMMMVDNGGNLFKSIEPSLRQKLLDASRKVLGLFGVVDPQTGNPLSVSILGKAVAEKNPILQRSKTIRNLYKNYVEQKEKSLVKKIDLADNPIGLKLEKGENAQQAVQRLFNTKGLSLKEAGAFRIKNRQIKKKLIEIRNRLFEKPEGEMGAETNEKGNPVYIVGKKLTDELKGIFTRNDPFGNINTLINMATEAIMQKAQMTMLYRAGKPSKYSDNELRPRVIAPVRFKITGLTNSSRSAASLKLDAFDEAYLRNNAEVLVAEGFEKNPNNLIDLGRQVALDAMNDPEGRINPKGKYENEVVTALFGQPESAPQIRNPKLRRLLEENRLKHAYRTYDIDGLAGLVPTGKSGISFDWFNVRNNYLPYDQNLFMPRQSKNFDKKVALRTNEDIIKQIDILAQQKGVSRNDLLNEILRDRVTEKTPDDSGIPVDSENVPPITEKEFQNLKDQSQKKAWSKDSDQDLNWLRNEPKNRLFMPAVNVEQRRAEKYGKMFQDAVKSDKEIIAQARRDWMENGFKAENFQAWITSGLERPALAREKDGIFEPIKLYYGGPLGMAKRPGFNPAAPLEILQKAEYAEGITRKADDQYTSDKTIVLTDNKNLAKQEQDSMYPGVKPLEFATNASYIFDPLYPQHLELLKKSIQDIEPNSPELATLDQLSSQPEDIYAYENLLKQAGWDGYRIPGKEGDGFAIFDAKKVKLIADQAGEGKFFTKDRPYGKVSGLFGRPLPSERMSAMSPRDRGSDVRFMPQMELDFEGSQKPVEAEPQGYTFWQLTGIDKNDKNIYKKVSDVLINTGTPEMDPQTALDYGPRLGLDVKRLRQEMEKAQARYRRGNRLYLPAAYHGSPHSFDPEPGFPLGRFRTDKIGTGEGAQAYGYGLYFSSKEGIAKYYMDVLSLSAPWEPSVKASKYTWTGKRKGTFFDKDVEKILTEKATESKDLLDMYNRIADEIISLKEKRDDIDDEGLDTFSEKQQTPRERNLRSAIRLVSDGFIKFVGDKPGSLYKVELAPKENEYLLWDKPLSEQPKGVREKLVKMVNDSDLQYESLMDEPNVLGERPGGEFYTLVEMKLESDLGLKVDRASPLVSKMLKEAGIPGIKYLTGESRSKGKGDYNYVIFDDSDVQITEKLFMPASEAGAGKGKQAEAAKLWQEKGTDSPYFKKWFGKSKVVDENGEPLVVYHGTSDQFTAFDADRYQTINKGDFGEGFYFTPKKGQAKLYSQDAIKKTDPEVLALQKEYESQAKQLGTSTMMAAIDLGLNSPEYKKLQQFENRLDQKLQSINKGNDEIIIESYLSLQNPLVVKSTSMSDPFLAQSAKERGHDGIIVKFDNGTIDEIVAFKPEQIKSATGNRGTFDAGERNILFMPASEAKNPKSGDMLTLDDKSLKLFLPSPGNPNASLSDFKGKNVQVLTTDLSMVGDKKIDGATVAFTGGPGYLSVNDAWGFTNESSAKGFRTRWEREGRPLIGLTSMKQDNHKASTLTREYYVRKFMQAINQGKISESLVNEHIIEALTRAAKGKGLTDSQKRALLSVKNIEDFLRIFSNGQIIPWKATPKIYDRLSQATLPIKQGQLKELGLDLDTILRETRQKEYNDIKKGSLLAIAEYDGSDAVYRPDLNSAYPWSIPLKEKAFLKDFADIQDLSSRQDLRGSDGDANMAVAMGAGVMLDKLGRGDVNFMPSGRPTRQPANRITRQAPAMPGNRFMAPASSAGARLSERFR